MEREANSVNRLIQPNNKYRRPVISSKKKQPRGGQQPQPGGFKMSAYMQSPYQPVAMQISNGNNSSEMDNIDRLLQTISNRDNAKENINRKISIKKNQMNILQPKKHSLPGKYSISQTVAVNAALMNKRRQNLSFDRPNSTIDNEYPKKDNYLQKQYVTIDVLSQSLCDDNI